MADDGKVEIDVGLALDELKKNINNIDKYFKQMSESADKNAKKADSSFQVFLKNLKEVSKDVRKCIDRATGGITAFIDTLANLTDAANAQGDAETKLAMAAKKNPYLDDYSVKKLKEYAGELQSVSEVGDEVLLPMMAELAAEGKNQAQIMDTMSAALDMAAGTGQDLNACIDALSKTYNGVSGALAKTYPEIANLTEEELRQGKAVEILGGKYKGMSEATASPFAQLKNSVGGLGEKLGGLLLPAAQRVASYLTTLVDTVNVLWGGFEKLSKKIDKLSGGAFSTLAAKLQGVTDKFKEWLKITQETTKLKLEQEAFDINTATAEEKFDHFTNKIKLLQMEIKELSSKSTTNINQMAKTLGVSSKELQKYIDAVSKWQNAGGDDEAFKTLTKDEKNVIENSKINMLQIKDFLILQAKQKELTDAFVDQSNARIEVGKKEAAEREQAAENAANAEAQANEEAKQSLLERYNAEMTALEQDWKAREKACEKITDEQKACEKITDEQKAQEKYNKAFQTYIALQKENAAAEKKADTSALDAKAQSDIAEQQKILTKAMDKKTLEQFKSESMKMFTELKDVSTESLGTYYKNLCTLRDTLIANISSEEAKEKLKKQFEELEEVYQKVFKTTDKKERHDIVLSNADSLVSDDTKKVLKDDGSPFGSTLDDYDAHAEAIKAAMAEIKQAHEDGLISDTEYLEREKALDEELRQSKFETFEQIGGKIMDFATQSNQILQDACNLWLESVKAESEAEQAEIEKKYKNGELSEEEYNEKMKEAKRKAAKEEYKIKMVQWASDLLLAQSNVAMGIASSMKLGAPAGIIAAAMTGAAGAVQLATAIANKPTPPSFATGGVVGGFGGASAGGDNTYAHVRTGEMILNAGQQKSLWEKLNARDNAPQRSGGNNVSITNNASNDVSAKAQFSEDKLNIYIDKRVNAGLSDGRYGKSLTMAEQMQEGIMYGI